MLATYAIPDVQQELYLDHRSCVKDAGVMGAFAVTLDYYQLDELAKNGYTLATEECLFCRERATLLLRTH